MSLFRALPVLRSAAAPRAAPRLAAAARRYSSVVDAPMTGPCFGLSEDQEAYQGASRARRGGCVLPS